MLWINKFFVFGSFQIISMPVVVIIFVIFLMLINSGDDDEYNNAIVNIISTFLPFY